MIDDIIGTEASNHSEPTNPRREFLSRCTGALQALLFAGVAGPLLEACETSLVLAPRGKVPTTVEIDVASLTTDGSFAVSSQNGSDGKKILVVRKSASTYIAMSMECTHLQCQVQEPEDDTILCLCHGSRYDMEGAVIVPQVSGQQPLRRYTSTFDAARSVVVVSY